MNIWNLTRFVKGLAHRNTGSSVFKPVNVSFSCDFLPSLVIWADLPNVSDPQECGDDNDEVG